MIDFFIAKVNSSPALYLFFLAADPVKLLKKYKAGSSRLTSLASSSPGKDERFADIGAGRAAHKPRAGF